MVELGLIGYPLGHSFSPAYFAGKFNQLGLEGKYSLFPIESIDKLMELLHSKPLLSGFNVTVPYKQKIIKFLDVIDKSASDIGAVNTVKIEIDDNGSRRLYGYNTDWIGFIDSLKPLLDGKSITKALVLGTGGAAHAVNYGLRNIGISPTFVSRNPLFSRLRPAIGYDEISKEVIGDNLLIVNTTPVGMHPDIDSFPPIPYNYLTPQHILYDLIYNPEVTVFLTKGIEKGTTVKNGLEMLHMQADAAWEIWNR